MGDYYHNIEEDLSLGMVNGDKVLKHVRHQRDRIEELKAKLAKAVDALEYSRETILELVNSRYSEAEGTDEDWVGAIDANLSELKEKNT